MNGSPGDITAPRRGEKVLAEWGRKVADAITRGRIVPGNGIKVTETATGTVLGIDRTVRKNINIEVPQVAGGTYLARVTGGDPEGFYTIDIYPNGMNGDPVHGYAAQCVDQYVDARNIVGRWIVVNFVPTCVQLADEYFGGEEPGSGDDPQASSGEGDQ